MSNPGPQFQTPAHTHTHTHRHTRTHSHTLTDVRACRRTRARTETLACYVRCAQHTAGGYRGFRKKRPPVSRAEACPTPGPNFKVRGVRRGGVRVVSKKTPTFANRFLRHRVNIDIGGAGGDLAPPMGCYRWAFISKSTPHVFNGGGRRRWWCWVSMMVTSVTTLPTPP